MSDIEREAPKIEEGEARRDNRSDLPSGRQAHRRSRGHVTARAVIPRCGYPLR